jgi:hypothetical protein
MVLAGAAQLMGGTIGMAYDSVFRDAEDAPNFPSRLAFHRPAQRF